MSTSSLRKILKRPQKVIGEIGEPMMRSDRTRDGVRTQVLHWINRTDQVQLRGTQREGTPWNIILYLRAPPVMRVTEVLCSCRDS